ncbi:MAG: repeat containing protein [Cyanobacteria bacterium RYN_339]|nr:repeat containing protein [Cyanobacteria bacterium RYN_339]
MTAAAAGMMPAMPSRARSILAFALAVLVAGCKVSTPSLAKVTKPSAAPAVLATAAPPVVGAGIVTDNGSGVIANNSAGLAGTVKAPASLLSDVGSGLVTDNGSGIVANHGAGLVGNNAGNYRLAAIAQVPVKGARVRLLDAAGQPVVGADGKPLEATTDATGAYRFEAVLPARNLVVAVELAGGKGTLEAIAPPAAKDRQADLDLVSTLTSAYILESYVKGQADPGQTLDKLPADVEAATRVKAAAALEGANVPPPASLTPAAVVAAVDGLRKADPAFDSQLEVVKKLLVAVGQSDLGAGRPAKEVRLRAIRNVLAAPAGGAYFTCPSDHRVWRLLPDGTLATAAGTGTAREDGAIDGVAGVDAPLVKPFGLALDAAGRLLILEHLAAGDRLSRLGKDGKLQQLWTGKGLLAAVPLVGDQVKLLLADLTWVQPQKDGAPKLLGTLDATKFADLAKATAFGVDAQGRVTLGVPGDAARAFLLDATGLDGTVVTEGDNGIEHLAVEAGGRLIASVKTGDIRSLVVQDAVGTRTTLVGTLPAGTFFDALQGAALAPDGHALVVQRGTLICASSASGLDRVAGLQAPPSGDARDVAIDTPNGMAVGPGGELYMCDKTTQLILRIDPDQKTSVLSGTGVAGLAGDGGPAVQAQQNLPRAIRIDGAGNLYVLQGGVGETVRKIAGGVITTAFKSADHLYIRDLSVTPDGKAYLALKGHNDGPCSVIRMAPDGTTTTILAPSKDILGAVIGVAPDGACWLLIGAPGKRTLVRWTDAGGQQVIKEDLRFAANYPNDSNGLAIDAKGRVIMTLWAVHQVLVYDPATDTLTQVAGVGGTHFNGDGVDDGIEAPRYPTIGPKGELFFSDTHHHQVKRIPAGEF